MKVLIVEDSARTANDLRTLLEDQGHEVTWIVGVTSVDDGRLDAYDSIMSRCVPRLHVGALDYRDYELVFVDGHLDGVLNGWELIPHLLQAGRQVVAISGSPGCNERMCGAGADTAVLKAEVLAYAADLAAQTC
jgi:CheY-like chemotaxis protein